MTLAQIRAVRRQIPQLANARAVVAVESNIAFLAGEIYDHLRRRSTPNDDIMMLHLDRAAKTRRRDDGTAEVAAASGGDEAVLQPGLRTSARFKQEVSLRLQHLLSNQRIFWHASTVCYSARNLDYERAVLGSSMDRRHGWSAAAAWRRLFPHEETPMPDEITTLDQVFEYERRVQTQAAFVAQFKNISYLPKVQRLSTGEVITKYRITGKLRDGDKDDLYMGLSIAILGAAFHSGELSMD